jgi:hypothetical protein
VFHVERPEQRAGSAERTREVIDRAQRDGTSGAHAAVFSELILASHRREVWLGSAAENDGSFPLTDGGDLPADSMLRAAC